MDNFPEMSATMLLAQKSPLFGGDGLIEQNSFFDAAHVPGSLTKQGRYALIEIELVLVKIWLYARIWRNWQTRQI